MSGQETSSANSGRVCWMFVAAYSVLILPTFGQQPSIQNLTWSKPVSRVPKEFQRAYVEGITKVGYELNGNRNWFEESGWLVSELCEIDDKKSVGGIPFPGGNVGDWNPPRVVGFVAVHVPSREIKFLSNALDDSKKWSVLVGESANWPDSNLAISTWPKEGGKGRAFIVWKWDLVKDRVSLAGTSISEIRASSSLIRALGGSGFSPVWPADLSIDWSQELRLRRNASSRTIAITLNRSKCEERSSPSPSLDDVFLPGSEANELINIKEAPDCRGQLIRCLKLGSSIQEKWKLTPEDIAEIAGESNWCIRVPNGLSRPCKRIPLMVGKYSEAKMWLLDTTTGTLSAGWSHPEFTGSSIRHFGVTSADGALLAVDAKHGFLLFDVEAGKMLYRTGETSLPIVPSGIDKHGKVIAQGSDGVWVLDPPYTKPAVSIFRLQLPPGWP